MIPENKLQPIHLICFAIIAFTGLITYVIYTSFYLSKTETVKTETELNIKVIKKEIYRSSLVVDAKKNKKYIFEHSINKEYYPSKLRLFIQTGDSISKKRNNDTIFIYRNKTSYFFINHKGYN